jgi:hypothetical protein
METALLKLPPPQELLRELLQRMCHHVQDPVAAVQAARDLAGAKASAVSLNSRHAMAQQTQTARGGADPVTAQQLSVSPANTHEMLPTGCGAHQQPSQPTLVSAQAQAPYAPSSLEEPLGINPQLASVGLMSIASPQELFYSPLDSDSFKKRRLDLPSETSKKSRAAGVQQYPDGTRAAALGACAELMTAGPLSPYPCLVASAAGRTGIAQIRDCISRSAHGQSGFDFGHTQQSWQLEKPPQPEVFLSEQRLAQTAQATQRFQPQQLTPRECLSRLMAQVQRERQEQEAGAIERGAGVTEEEQGVWDELETGSFHSIPTEAVSSIPEEQSFQDNRKSQTLDLTVGTETAGAVDAAADAGAGVVRGRMLETKAMCVLGRRARSLSLDGLTLQQPGEQLQEQQAEQLVEQQVEQQAKSMEPRVPSSQYRGVWWDKRRGKWKASLCRNGKQRCLGIYEIEKEAAEAYDTAVLLDKQQQQQQQQQHRHQHQQHQHQQRLPLQAQMLAPQQGSPYHRLLWTSMHQTYHRFHNIIVK